MLELTKRSDPNDIRLMTHIVLGHPSFDDSLRIIEAMVEAGVDLMELQIPFSEPMADGPIILRANQAALAAGSTVDRCLALAGEVTSRFGRLPFLFMSYYNILFRRGVDAFVHTMAGHGVQGAIVPDLPHEEAADYLTAMRREALDPIFLYSPNTSDARMREIARQASGFIYCVARKGVTGATTRFAQATDGYLARCRAATDLPLAVGFGVQEKADVDFLRGKADIAVVGTQTLRVIEQDGVGAVADFIRTLR